MSKSETYDAPAGLRDKDGKEVKGKLTINEFTGEDYASWLMLASTPGNTKAADQLLVGMLLCNAKGERIWPNPEHVAKSKWTAIKQCLRLPPFVELLKEMSSDGVMTEEKKPDSE